MMALEGLRVLDLTRYLPGPYCTMLLGDLGADVVKVEEPFLGDPTRALPPAVGEDSVVHAALNRNKRSLALDLRTEAGAAIVKQLAGRSDVLIESMRPGVLRRRGLGPEALQEANPRLVFCSLTGYGQDGPLSLRAGHDIDYVARGGFLGANRDKDGRSVMPGAQVADMIGGLLATVGILTALQARERTGRGQIVDVSMLEGVLALMTVPLTRLMAGAHGRSELGGSHACYNVYRCRDGRELAVGALEPKFWETLCHSVGLPQMAGRQWDEGESQREVTEAFERVFATRDSAEWVFTLAGKEVCVDPVLDPCEVQGEPQALLSLVTQTSGPSTLKTVRTPVRLSETPAAVRREAPGLGEHTTEVLGELGYSPSDIDKMRTEGIVA